MSSLRLVGSRKVIEHLAVLYRDRSAGAAIDEDLTPLVLSAAAERDPSVFSAFIAELEDGSTPEQVKVDILSAMGGFKDEKTALRVFTYAADSVSPRNRHYPFTGAGRNPAVYTALWGWFRKNVRKLCSFHPIILDRALAGFVPTAFVRVADEADVILAEAAAGPAAKTAATVRMLRESLSVNRAFRDRETKSV